MKGSQVLGIILAVTLIVFGAAFPVPEKYVYVSSSSYAYDYPWTEDRGAEYVGGDAYNYQMEASLKAGYMSGVLAMKSISFVGGLLLFFLTLYSRVKCVAIEEQTRVISDMAQSAEKRGKALEKLSNSADEQTAILNALSATLDKYISPIDESNVEEEMV